MGGNKGRDGKWRMLGHTLRVGFQWDGMRVERKKVLYIRLWNGSIEKLSGGDECRQYTFEYEIAGRYIPATDVPRSNVQ